MKPAKATAKTLDNLFSEVEALMKKAPKVPDSVKLKLPNIRGFLVRIPGSRFYRAPTNNRPDVPGQGELDNVASELRHMTTVLNMKIHRSPPGAS